MALTEEKPPPYSLNINGLRGVCALLVVLHHVWKGPAENQWFDIAGPILTVCNWIIDSWKFQVEIFFMISGYLILKTLLRKRDLTEFAVDRALRIYPVFLFIHILIFSVAPFAHDVHLMITGPGVWLKEFIENVLLLPGIFTLPIAQLAAWSLSYELAFYISVGLTYFIWKRQGEVAGLALAAVFSLVFIWFHPSSIFFLAGIAVYFIERKSNWRIRLNLTQSVVLWVALLLLLERAPFGEQSPMPLPTNFYLIGFNLAGGILGIVYFAGVIHPESGLSGLLRMPAVQYLGKISYSLYLWHEVIEFPLKRIILRYLPAAPAALKVAVLLAVMLPLSLLVAHLSYHYIEKRLTRRIQAWIEDLRAPRKLMAHDELGNMTSPG